MRTIGVFIGTYIALSVLLSSVGLDRAPFGLIVLGLAIVAAVIYKQRSRAARSRRNERGSTRVEFVRRHLNLTGDAKAHHFIAMRAKEEDDYQKTINAALDMWDRFGFSWLVTDALDDGFIIWARQSQYSSQEGSNLALQLHRRARSELPRSLADAPRDMHSLPPIDPVSDWTVLFKDAERFHMTLPPEAPPPEDLRLAAETVFDDLCELPPTIRAEWLRWLTELNDAYGVGNMSHARAGLDGW